MMGTCGENIWYKGREGGRSGDHGLQSQTARVLGLTQLLSSCVTLSK